ncbi:MAG: hypothetical protein EA385_10535 [Salinarimonadaceae bacterium]|nr:MAG: hypothetical protein EA385_10535 [Salinarimonadaceae bacterium]
MTIDRRDPYAGGYGEDRANYPRSPSQGIFVAVLHRIVPDRGLRLIREHARCIRGGEIHELILTEEETAIPGAEADLIAYLGFIEFTKGGVVVAGDRFFVNNTEIARVAGYDETHMPNHMNIVVRGKGLVPGFDRGIMLGDRFTIVSPYGDRRFTATTSAAP